MEAIATALRDAAKMTRDSRESAMLGQASFSWEYEFAGRICCNRETGDVYPTHGVKGKFRDDTTDILYDSPLEIIALGHNAVATVQNVANNHSLFCKDGYDAIAFYHSHVTGDTELSPGDIGISKRGGLILMLAADGTVIKSALFGKLLPPTPLPPEPEGDAK